MIKALNPENTRLLPGIFKDRASINRNYLMKLDTHCLLQNYYLEAGMQINGMQTIYDPSNAKIHWGWESPTCQLRGHFLGHWLSAASMLISTNDDKELKAKLDVIIDELEKCQKANGGKWVAPIPEKYFTILEKETYIWSPQYTMHKLILGLTHAYVYAKNKKALTILNNLADWYIKWTDKILKSDNPGIIYHGEEAGMTEVWAELYRLTEKPKYETLAQRYGNSELYDRLLKGQDGLSNTHMNASIPYFHGAAKLYQVTNDEKYLAILEKFWESAVEKRGTYCTGGQSAGEFWVAPNNLAACIGDRNQEFCTVYNMVRVADYLYQFTGKVEYLDYIETNIYNGFLAQQNKFTGMPTYFLPMKSGAKKLWGSETRDFWCCHGTMIQAQTLYPELCYYHNEEEDKVIVAQYIPSEAEIVNKDDKIKISQSIDMKYYAGETNFDDAISTQTSRWQMKFTIQANSEFTLAFRLPGWLTEQPKFYLNGAEIDVSIKSGYLNIKKLWKDDVVTVYFPTKLTTTSLSDMPEKVAIQEGPIVLAGLTDNDYGLKYDDLSKLLRPAKEHTYSAFPWQQSTYRTVNQSKETTFIPLYEVTDEQYTLYFTKKEESQEFILSKRQ